MRTGRASEVRVEVTWLCEHLFPDVLFYFPSLYFSFQTPPCVTRVLGLYPLACMMNHQCVPNVRYCFDANHVMRVQATKNIMCGEEIFTSYIQIFWGTYSRRVHLTATKDFMCNCPRCSDPTVKKTATARKFSFGT